jgi:hypothetical protein
MSEWMPIESAPKDRYFIAVALPERAEEKLIAAIFGDDADRHLIVARLRPKQRKGRVFMSVTGRPFSASHWMDLPEMPQ